MKKVLRGLWKEGRASDDRLELARSEGEGKKRGKEWVIKKEKEG